MNYAKEWEAEHAFREMLYEEPLAPVRKWFDRFNNKEMAILDIGCGAGSNSIWLARQGFRVCGFDSSPSAIGRLLVAATDRTRWKLDRLMPRVIVADATAKWPYQTAAFDAAFEVRVLENLTAEEAQFAYKEVGRVLKPGGVFFSLTASPGRETKWTTVGKMRPITDLDLAAWLATGGLKIEHISREYEGTLEDWNVHAVKQ